MTNETVNIGLPPGANTLIGELIAWILPVITAALLALWRKAARNSALQTTAIKAIVRGMLSEDDDTDLRTVKQAVKAETAQAGVTEHVEKIVATVKSEANGRDGQGI